MGNNYTPIDTLSSSTRPKILKIGNNEVPHHAPHVSPIAKTKIPPSLNFSLNPSIFPGYFQALKSLFQLKTISGGTPFVSPSNKTTMLPSTDPLPDTSIIPSKDSTYFLSDQPTSTPPSNLKIYTSNFPTVKYTPAPINIPS